MKIESSNIQLSSKYSFVERQTVSESVRIWVGDERPDFEGRGSSTPAKGISVSDVVTLSNMAETSQRTAKIKNHKDKSEAALDPETRMLKLIVERMLGMKIDLPESTS
jgi:hypothetical protein